MKPGDFVNLYMNDPIEKVWGRLVSLSSAGITVRGIDIKYIEAFKYQFNKEDRDIFPQTVFWPMRRVQKMVLDEPMEGTLPSVIESMIASSRLGADEIIPLPDHPYGLHEQE